MNYYTRYYESMSLDGLNSAVHSCIDSLQDIKTTSSEITSFASGDAWESDAKVEVKDAMQKNDFRIDELCRKMDRYQSAIPLAKKVVEMQKYMRSKEMTESELKDYSNQINQLVNQIVEIMKSI